MEVKKVNLYHIHRNGNIDGLWDVGNKIKVDDNFNSLFYEKLLVEEQKLIERYGNYDIDYIIKVMEEIKTKKIVGTDIKYDFNLLLKRYYFLRREKALEEGRKIFNPTAPSRFHSLFLTNEYDMNYWIKCIGYDSYKIFLMELNGNLFVSSDEYFPNYNLTYDIQVEQSKAYWKPKILTIRKEFLFQGESKIIE